VTAVVVVVVGTVVVVTAAVVVVVTAVVVVVVGAVVVVIAAVVVVVVSRLILQRKVSESHVKINSQSPIIIVTSLAVFNCTGWLNGVTPLAIGAPF
jgi:hypothetical protein